MKRLLSIALATLPVPGYPGYTPDREGNLFFNGCPRKPLKKKGVSLKIRLQRNGTRKDLGLAKLVATVFLPNPEEHKRVVFIDGNLHHCAADHRRRVSESEFARSTMLKNRFGGEKGRRRNNANPTMVKSGLPPTCTATEAAPLPGFEGYQLTPSGNVYCGNALLKPCRSKDGKALPVRTRYGDPCTTGALPNWWPGILYPIRDGTGLSF